MRNHFLPLAAIGAALLTLSPSLQAQGCGAGFGPGRGNNGPGCGSYGPGRGMGRGGFMGLNLTEAQQSKVQAIHGSHAAAIETKANALQAAHQALREAMRTASTDAKALRVLHEKASASQFDLMLEHRAVHQEILPLLTPEQKTQFEAGSMGMRSRGGRGMGQGYGPGMGRGYGSGMGRGNGPGMNPDCPNR